MLNIRGKMLLNFKKSVNPSEIVFEMDLLNKAFYKIQHNKLGDISI
jgi:hypothetical protein